jgi:8-hydroxy-5-deazaflavin:NADPH oxidoreductase
MKIAMIGGGMVGQGLAAALLSKGHDVQIGIRNVNPAELAKERNGAETLATWQKRTGGKVVTFAEAAKHAEIIFNVTSGGVSLEALTQAGAENLKGKILVDVSNPLDFSKGMPAFLSPAYTTGTSVGEEIQKAFPDARVVKAFNTISHTVMVNPSLISGEHDLFIAGNDAAAKKTVHDLATKEFGWKSVVDLGDIVGARATEALLPLWLRLWMTGGSPNVNIRVARPKG